MLEISNDQEFPFAADSAIDLGTRIELFVDEWLIESKTNLELQLSPPIKEEIVLETNRHWEGEESCYFVALQEAGRVRLYYRGFALEPHLDDSPLQAACYIESTDGINFVRPNLGIYEFEGSTLNNIGYEGVEAHNFAPFIDNNPAAKSGERYKAVGGLAGCFYVFASPDGIHWSKWHPSPIDIPGKLDSLNIVFWDEVAGLYRCYARYFEVDSQGTEIRAIHSMTSLDLIHWSAPKPNRYGDEVPLEQFYTNASTPIPGAPHILLSFPMRFVEERQKVGGHSYTGVSDTVFMSSRDGLHWDRTFRDAWIRPGLDQRNWTERSNMVARGIVQTSSGEYSVYVSEHYRWPSNRLRRYSIRRDGFASLHAGHKQGEWLSRPLRFRGSKLVLNYSTSAAGFLQVEVQDEAGRALPGYALADMDPLFGDELGAVVRWKEGRDLENLRGRVVRFRFVMQEADLFALRTALK